MIEIVKRKKKDLIFYDTDTINFKSKLPLLIDKDNNVIAGNCLRNNFKNDDDINCVILKNSNDFIADTIYEFENAVAEENSIERFYAIESELSKYIKNENTNIETFTLFDSKETRCITEELFIPPPPYNFKKHKRKEEVEDENEFNLFNYDNWEETG